jgi:hypothetical protein
MKQLKPEHIAPYLPYEIKVKGKNSNEIAEVQSLSPNVNSLKLTNNPYYEDIENFVLVLRPLNYLIEEIEFDGEKFKPIFFWNENPVWNTIHMTLSTMAQYKRDIGFMLPYFVHQKLFQWHFDVFGLIDEGLAVDYNDV